MRTHAGNRPGGEAQQSDVRRRASCDGPYFPKRIRSRQYGSGMSWHTGRLAAFDIETTGTDPESDRIVTAAISLVGAELPGEHHAWLIDPGIEIPAGAAAVHGITTERARAEGRDAAARVAYRLGVVVPELRELDLRDLYGKQISWAAKQAALLEEYFKGQGRNEQVEGAWPIVPVGAVSVA
jgi:DNA polymerase III epsilon subunit-like protein